MTETKKHTLSADDSAEVIARLKRALDYTYMTKHPIKYLRRIRSDIQWVLSKLGGG